jgi:hypothetical protein
VVVVVLRREEHYVETRPSFGYHRYPQLIVCFGSNNRGWEGI